MKYKTLVINEDEWGKSGLLGCGCNRWNYNEFQARRIIRREDEKCLSEMFNEVARQGYKLKDEQIRRHALYIDNHFEEFCHHGIYRFEENVGEPEEYYFYFGPLMNIEEENNAGCFNFDGIGCGGIGCGDIGCGGKLPWMGCGCGRKSGSDEQFLNFKENDKNEPRVQKLNEYFGLREEPYNFREGYIWDCATLNEVISMDEYIKDNYDYIKSVFQADVKEIEDKGFHFERIVDLPSKWTESSQAMMFSKSSKRTISMIDQNTADSLHEESQVNLSDFDVWYYPTVYGFFGWLRRIIVEYIPLAKYIPFLAPPKEIDLSTGHIDDANKLLLETQYNEDFHKQLDEEKKICEIKDRLKTGDVPDTAEIHISSYSRIRYKWAITRFFRRLFHGVEYKLDSSEPITFLIK